MNNPQELFISLVSYDTQSCDESETYPSTKSQLGFGQILVDKCKQIGLSGVEMDEYGYVTAVLPSNIQKEAPVAGFVAHMDTAPSSAGGQVNPRIVENYDGGDIQLKEGMILSPQEFPHMRRYIGQTLIVTDGNTLLGADDKAGVAEILTAMEYLIQNPDIEHGTVKIVFTPDEEVGRGVDHFDVKKFGADFAYTVDGGQIGELEFENFNAARAKIFITGKSVHPGTAKGIMINAALIAAEIANRFPQNETPATTEDYQGFFHLTQISGDVETSKLDYIIRDFDKEKMNQRKKFVENVVREYNEKYGKDMVRLQLYDEYYNMAEILKDKQNIIALAQDAMKEAGITPLIQPIRGGTDGSRLSFMGLPCPNIFTGGHNAHGPYEYISVESMVKAAEVVVNICKLVCQ